MKTTTFLFPLALFLLDTATSAPLPLTGDVNVANTVNLHNHASILVPVDSRKRSISESSGSLERRMVPLKGLGKKPKKDDEDNGKPSTSSPGSSRSKEDIKKNLEEENAATRAQIEEAKRLKKEANERKKAEQKAANEKHLQDNPDAGKKKDDREEVTIRISKLTDAELAKFWTYFSKPKKGKDNLGLVERSAIAAAFMKCIPNTEKLLFWSSGSSDAFRKGAIEPYAKKEGRFLIADMASSADCRKEGLASIDRKSIKAQIKDWKQKEEVENYHEKNKKQANKKYKYTYIWAPGADEEAYTTVGRKYYWPVMSQGFADAASGEVLYLRPDRNGDLEDYAGGIWKDYELPALKANSRVKKVTEVTMPLNVASNPNLEITPGSERVRHS